MEWNALTIVHAAKRDTLPRYRRDSDVRFACHAGCPKDWFATTPGGEPGLQYLCPGFKAFLGHIRSAMEAICQLLRSGRQVGSGQAGNHPIEPMRQAALRVRMS